MKKENTRFQSYKFQMESRNDHHPSLGRANQAGEAYAKPARNCKLLAAIEAFMNKHSSNEFSTIGAALELAARDNKRKRVLPWDDAGRAHWDHFAVPHDDGAAPPQDETATPPFEQAPPPKRTRIHISDVGQQFIDTYVQDYIGLKGNASGRKGARRRRRARRS